MKPKGGKTIVLVRNAYQHDFGGAERFPINLALELKKLGWRPVIVSRSARLLEHAKKADLQTIKGWWWSAQNWSGKRAIFFPVYLIWQFILFVWYFETFSSLEAQVVHLQSKDDFIAGTLAAKLLRKKVIWTDHADLKYVYANHRLWYKNPIGKTVYLASRLADKITLVSRDEQKSIEKALGRKLGPRYEVVHNGVPDVRVRPVAHQAKGLVFCATSRLVSAKGIGELIEAFKKVLLKHPEAELWLVGDGPEETKFKDQAAANRRIKFLGYSDEALRYVEAADIFVHPSYHEGLSLSVVEAAMLGKPIIATDAGGNPEVITDGQSGILVPPKDPDALTRAMLKLAGNDDLRRSLGRQARMVYESGFKFEAIVKDRFIPIYETRKLIKILFDANPLAAGGKSGVGYYTYYLVQSLADAYPDKLQLTGHYYNFLASKKNVDLPTGTNVVYKSSRLWPGKATNLLRRLGAELPFELLIKQRGDVLLFPNFLNLPSLFSEPIVTVIHDLGYLDHPEFVSSRNLRDLQTLVPKTINRSRLIIVNSRFTKERVQQTYGLSDNELLLTPIPPLKVNKLPANQAASLAQKLGIERNFILFIGNLEPRKNLSSLIEAYVRLDERLRSEFSLVLAGGRGWKNEQLSARISELQAADYNIITPGYITDDEKAALYQRATAVILPSYYEGFGMPILEAYSYGVAMAVSDIEVLREVAQNGAVFFDPADVDDIKNKISSLLESRRLRTKLIKAQPAVVAKYSWTETAHQLYRAFEDLTTS